jgi:xanthine dehydrogenase accessory factor
MKEINDIINAYDSAFAAGKRAALATVVHVEGSSYRRAGARMLVTDDGMLTGAISGGCLEGDALRKALLAINEQTNKLVTYDTNDEDDASFGVQLGCNGIVHILFEPILTDVANNPIQLLKRVSAQREKAVLVSLFSLTNKNLQPGLCMLQIGSQTWINAARALNAAPGLNGSSALNKSSALNNSSALSTDILDDLKQQVAQAFNHDNSITKQYADGELSAYIELLQPALSLIICGAGNDAIPLLQAADIVGFDTTIIDGRQTHANPPRFPTANAVIISNAEQALSKVKTDERTAWVLMTHNYNYDIKVLTQLLEINCRYIGILGPKKKLLRMLDEIAATGTQLTKEKLDNIYSPVGLDIGAETAEDIAISIVAEIKAVFSSRNGQSLRDKQEAIHSRDLQISLKR